MQNSFRISPLAWSTLPDIDRDFFNRCEMQFHHIRQTVRNSFSAAGIDIRKTEVELEPSFLCEALGLQGRMDLLTRNADKLVELKSGKPAVTTYYGNIDIRHCMLRGKKAKVRTVNL